jgi:protein O-mannosyl-transferase
MTNAKANNFSNKSAHSFACLAIVFAGILLYANSLHYPFQFDSIRYIPNNPVMRDPGQLLTFDYLWQEYTRRAFLMSSLALNVQWGGFDPFGFRLLNMTVHILNSLLIYFISLKLCRSLHLFNEDKPGRTLCSILSALLFLTHPLQTESVLMVMSRAGIIAGFFYLSAFLIFQNMLECKAHWGKTLKFVSGLAIAVCFFAGAGFKQTIVTLPCMLLIYYLCCLEPKHSFFLQIKKWRVAIGTILFLIFGILFWKLFSDETFLIGYSDAGEAIGRKNYMLSQPAVLIFYYFRLALFPFNLNVDPDFPMTSSFAHPAFWGSCALIVAAMIFAYRQACKGNAVYLFCLTWMLIVISPSSSIVTLHDLAAEHRVYLASFGLFFIFSVIFCKVFALGKSTLDFKPFVFLGLLMLFLLSATTLKRSTVWSSESQLWSDATEKSPRLLRPLVNLARGYSSEGRFDESIIYYERALTINPNIFFANYNLGDLYYQEGRKEDAVQLFLRAIQIKPSIPETYARLGEIYMELGHLELADQFLREAVEKNPNSPVAFRNLGVLHYFKWKKIREGKAFFKRSLTLAPSQDGAEQIRQLLAVNENEMNKKLLPKH